MTGHTLWSDEDGKRGYVVVHKAGDPAPAESLLKEFKAMAAKLDANRWYSVKEKLPQEGEQVLAFDANARNPTILLTEFFIWHPYPMEIAFIDARGFLITNMEARRGHAKEITHWHPVPKEPK